LEQLFAFGEPHRDPMERTVSIAYFSLMTYTNTKKQISHDYHAEWFPIKKIPSLVFDHRDMIELAKEKLRL